MVQQRIVFAEAVAEIREALTHSGDVLYWSLTTEERASAMLLGAIIQMHGYQVEVRPAQLVIRKAA